MCDPHLIFTKLLTYTHIIKSEAFISLVPGMGDLRNYSEILHQSILGVGFEASCFTWGFIILWLICLVERNCCVSLFEDYDGLLRSRICIQ